MVENCTVYLPTTSINFQSLLPGGTSEVGSAAKPTIYEYETPQGCVKLTINYASDGASHLDGLAAYIGQLENSEDQIREALALVGRTELFLGVILPAPVSPSSETFQSLLFLIDQLDGFIFVSESILVSDGFLVGPMTYDMGNAQIEPEQDQPTEASYEAQAATGNVAEIEAKPAEDETRKPPAHLVAIRDQNVALLASRGFICAAQLPIVRSNDSFGNLRPSFEIAQRLLAQFALFMWVAAPEEKATTEGIDMFITDNSLMSACTDRERSIFDMKRDDANAKLGGTIGWSLENIWVLSWIFGFEPEPAFQSGQIPTDTTNSVLAFMPNLGETVAGFLEKNPCRSEKEVVKKEDLFYCAHGAVRSAQLGEPAVPEDFNPIADGGAVHERRHALTWCLSPNVSWEHTDLST